MVVLTKNFAQINAGTPTITKKMQLQKIMYVALMVFYVKTENYLRILVVRLIKKLFLSVL